MNQLLLVFLVSVVFYQKQKASFEGVLGFHRLDTPGDRAVNDFGVPEPQRK